MVAIDSTTAPFRSSNHSSYTSPYVGRFAPSPSGPLHYGSLVCALASFLDARAQGGRWLLRMEDIDPPREMPGAQDAILRTLELHGLLWDGDLLRQSTRYSAYSAVLAELQQHHLCYGCNCSRQRLQSLGGIYDGHCRLYPPPSTDAVALRLKASDLPAAYSDIPTTIHFDDALQGPQLENLTALGDFVIHRKDGLFAYQLAVVVDDIAQGITHVVRGSDLLDTTARQIYLFNLLGKPAPHYCHIPVVVDAKQQKLSKQNHAPAVDDSTPTVNLWRAMGSLGLSPPTVLRNEQPHALLLWGIEQWVLDKVPRQRTIAKPPDACVISRD